MTLMSRITVKVASIRSVKNMIAVSENIEQEITRIPA